MKSNIIVFILIYFIFYVILVAFTSSLSINNLSKNKQQNIHKMERISELIEKSVKKYKIRMTFKNKKEVKVLLAAKRSKLIVKMSALKDNLFIYLLKKYIYRILNKILKDSKSLELVKKEILKAPSGAFTEFIQLYNEITQELHKRSIRNSVNIDCFMV